MSILEEYWDETLYFHHTYDEKPLAHIWGMHMHDECELLYFISGTAKSLVEGAEYALRPGCLLIVRPLELHRIQILQNTPYERISMHFSERVLESVDPSGLLLSPFHDRPLGQDNLYTPEEFQGLDHNQLLRNMCVSKATGEQRMNILIHLYPLLSEIRRAFAQKRNLRSARPKNKMVDELICYIDAHLYEELSLPMLSRRFFVSTSQLNRQFKSVTSSNVWEYILLKRLVAARTKIKNGSPVMEACQSCGFKDYSSFYRAYVKKFGLSPKRDKAAGSTTITL